MVDEDRFTPSIVPIGPYHTQVQPNPAGNKGKEPLDSISNPAEIMVKKPLENKRCSQEKDIVANQFFISVLKERQKNNLELTLDSRQTGMVREELRKQLLLVKAEDFYPDLDTQPGDFVRMMMQDGMLTGDTDQTLLRQRVRNLLVNGLYIRDRATEEQSRLATEPSHLLHLAHIYLGPTMADIALDIDNPDTGAWRRATLYRKSYVKFKRREFEDGKVESVLDVSLQGRTLLIPCLRIDGDTWTILRNLMALEEQMSNRPVTAYCVFMSQFARQADDVELLENEGIIDNFLGNNEELVQGFSNLCKGVINDKKGYLDDIWHGLRKHSMNPGNKFMGSFGQRNLADNVQFIAFLGAILLLVLQIAQVIIGCLPLIKKPGAV
ncbi:unnamed protein product [Alopecurus aequalis]